jgi:hypothetical protein
MASGKKNAAPNARVGRSVTLVAMAAGGVGLSDPVALASPLTVESWTEKVLSAVLDAVGSERAVVAASDMAGFIGVLFFPGASGSLATSTGFRAATGTSASASIPSSASRSELLSGVDMRFGRVRRQFAGYSR